MERTHSINKRQLKNRRSRQKHTQEICSGAVSFECLEFEGRSSQVLHSAKVSSSCDDCSIQYIDSSDDETGSQHQLLIKTQLDNKESGHHTTDGRIEHKNNYDIMPSASNFDFKETKEKSASLTPNISHYSQVNKTETDERSISLKRPSQFKVKSIDESQKLKSNSSSKAHELLKTRQTEDQPFCGTQSEIRESRISIKRIKEDEKKEKQITRIISKSQEFESEAEIMSMLLGDENEFDNTIGGDKNQKGVWGIIGIINTFFEYIIWKLRKLIYDPKFEIFVLTLCGGLLLYIFDLFSDIANGIMLLYNGKKYVTNYSDKLYQFHKR